MVTVTELIERTRANSENETGRDGFGQSKQSDHQWLAATAFHLPSGREAAAILKAVVLEKREPTGVETAVLETLIKEYQKETTLDHKVFQRVVAEAQRVFEAGSYPDKTVVEQIKAIPAYASLPVTGLFKAVATARKLVRDLQVALDIVRANLRVGATKDEMSEEASRILAETKATVGHPVLLKACFLVYAERENRAVADILASPPTRKPFGATVAESVRFTERK